MEKPSMRIEVITPDVAGAYLSLNTRNRAIRKTHLDDLTKAMRAGEWVLNGQPIIFDDFGNLIDGQHRLSACVASGTAFISYVVCGVSDARAFTTIDTGKPRGAHDMATYMRGLTANQAKDCVAAARIVLAYDSVPDKADFRGYYGGTQSEIRKNEYMASYTLSLMPTILECSDHIGGRFQGLCSKSVLTACCYLFARKSKQDAFAFFDMLHDGVFSSAHHPVKMLRDVLMMRDRSARKSYKEVNGEIMALIFKAWAAYRKNKEVRLLRWSREGTNRERFPELV